MVALGVWQLGRADEKEALLASYAEAGEQPAVTFPRSEDAVDASLYRRSSVLCESVNSLGAVAGKSAQGRSGLAVIANCKLDGGGEADVVLGWKSAPNMPDWSGGEVTGLIAPGPRLVADPPLAGLEAVARPDPADLPNNHLAYAGQWFFFAMTALVIYFLALRRRRKE